VSRVVVTGRIPQVALDSLRSEHEVSGWDSTEQDVASGPADSGGGCPRHLSLLTERIDGEALDAAGEQLQVVANVAVGYNDVDMVACASAA
jgi:glyoxylate reductase